MSHEDSGRKVKISENEKLPWAWQIEKDDAVLRDTFFRTLDELYLFLEQTDIKEWKDSPLRTQQQQSILRTLDQFESIYPLDGSFCSFEGDGDSRPETFGVRIPDWDLAAVCRFISG